MSNTIVLNVDNIDLRALGKKYEPSEELQIDAYTKLIRILDDVIADGGIKHSEHIYHTLFVDGKRGSGKTFFLLNIERYLRQTEWEHRNQLYFFDPIDPTLLHHNEHFLTIVIARILNQIREDKHFSNCGHSANPHRSRTSDYEKDEFYTTLTDLLNALDSTYNPDNGQQHSTSIIARDQLGLTLRTKVHCWFQYISKQVLKGKKIVLLIDDVDMALDLAREVLEVIRIYLTGPDIVTILSGDIALYKRVMGNHFSNMLLTKAQTNQGNGVSALDADNEIEAFTEERTARLFDQDRTLRFVSALNDDYFIKLFPPIYRIKIKNVYEFSSNVKSQRVSEQLKGLEVIELKKEGDDQTITFKDALKQFLLNHSLDQSARFSRVLIELKLRPLLHLLRGEWQYFTTKIKIADPIINLQRIGDTYDMPTIKDRYPFFMEAGNSAIKRGNTQAAIRYWNSAKSDRPGEFEAYWQLGKLYTDQNKLELACETYKVAVLETGENVFSVFEFGKSLVRVNNFKDALSALNRCTKTLPEIHLSDLYSNTGVAYIGLKDLHNASESFRRSIQYDPGNWSSYHNLGKLYRDLRRFDEAVDAFRRAINLNAKSKIAILSLMEVHLVLNEDAAAEISPYIEPGQDDAQFLVIYDMLSILNKIAFHRVRCDKALAKWLKDYHQVDKTWNLATIEVWIDQSAEVLQSPLLFALNKFKSSER